jgi:RNA 3'-phosphate cyclase
MIILDGSYGEGGGQMLRTALLLSMLTGQPFRIEDIRRGRSNPGLKPQHLHVVQALRKMSDAQVEGLAPGALSLTFYPAPLRGGVYDLDIGTAGAIPLFLQTILPVAMFTGAPVTFTVTGGTDVRGAMSIDFWRYVLLPFLRPYALQLDLIVQRRGFYPTGGGRVQFTVSPALDQHNWPNQRARWPPLAIPARGELRQVQIYSLASRALGEQKVATRQASACYNHLHSKPPKPQIDYVETRSPGSVLTAVADYAQTRLGADALGERGKASEQVGVEAAERLNQEMQADGTVDVHTADNLMVWVALFGGGYSFAAPTGHITTNAWVIEHFLPGALRLENTELFGPASRAL